MSSSKLTVAQLLASLNEKGLLENLGESEVAATKLLSKADEDDSPWYIKALIGSGAWMASIFFMLFLAISGAVPNDRYSLFVCGIFLLATSTYFRRCYEHTFQAQFALSLFVTGYILFLASGSAIFKSLYFLPFASAALCLLFYKVNPERILRFLNPCTVLLIWTCWVIAETNHHLLNLLVVLEVTAAFFLFTSFISLYRPAAFAMAIAAPATLLISIMYSRVYTNWLPTRLFLTIAFIYLTHWLANKRLPLKKPPLLFVILAIVSIAIVGPTGLLAALLLLVFGHGIHNKGITTIGLLFIPVFLVYFYYYLAIDLAYKSWTLIASGLVLLGLRHIVNKWTFEKKEQALP